MSRKSDRDFYEAFHGSVVVLPCLPSERLSIAIGLSLGPRICLQSLLAPAFVILNFVVSLAHEVVSIGAHFCNFSYVSCVYDALTFLVLCIFVSHTPLVQRFWFVSRTLHSCTLVSRTAIYFYLCFVHYGAQC